METLLCKAYRYYTQVKTASKITDSRLVWNRVEKYGSPFSSDRGRDDSSIVLF